jgi:peptide/nickel transport system substrate-binding protein
LVIGAPILPDADPRALLEAVGWVDDDANPVTARISKGVENVTDLTPFEINLYSGQGALDTAAAAEVGQRLGACGIEVNVSNLPAAQLYAPGPEGILFGRNFDLAIVNWAGYTREANHCGYYLSSQVPSVENNWVGTNLPGYKDLAYDVACLTSTLSQDDPIDPIIALDLVPRAEFRMSRDGVLH